MKLPLRAALLCLIAASSIVAQNTPPSIPVTLFGEARTRSEWDHPVGAAPADVFDLHQGYLELNGTLGGATSSVRAGRQEIVLGNERLVGAVVWSNTGRSFDGARWTLTQRGTGGAERWSMTTFAAVVEERGQHFGAASSPSADHSVGAVFARHALPNGGSLDATLLYDGDANYHAYTGANRTTFDGRLFAPRLGDALRVELEGAYQAGAQRFTATTGSDTKQTVAAWLAAARVGTPSTDGRRASATLGADIVSGDASPSDGHYSAFSTMFATNHPFYGLMDIIADPATTTKVGGRRHRSLPGQYRRDDRPGLQPLPRPPGRRRDRAGQHRGDRAVGVSADDGRFLILL
ncbi:MAG TPA: alginate export family protein [Gemmatimonadaceae bacterium]